jgi:hypothetical protein
LHIPNKKEETTMEIIIEKGCGLDVHKETVVGCIMGTGIKKEIMICYAHHPLWPIHRSISCLNVS